MVLTIGDSTASRHFFHHAFVVRQHHRAKLSKLSWFHPGDESHQGGVQGINTGVEGELVFSEPFHQGLGLLPVGFHYTRIIRLRSPLRSGKISHLHKRVYAPSLIQAQSEHGEDLIFEVTLLSING